MNINTTIKFIGAYDNPTEIPYDATIGDAMFSIDTNEIMLFVGNEWIEIGSKDFEEPLIQNKKKLRNCRNCGAPSGLEDYCEYCGSSLLVGEEMLCYEII